MPLVQCCKSKFFTVVSWFSVRREKVHTITKKKHTKKTTELLQLPRQIHKEPFFSKRSFIYTLRYSQTISVHILVTTLAIQPSMFLEQGQNLHF